LMLSAARANSPSSSEPGRPVLEIGCWANVEKDV
jgi:hypothetical protein